MYDHTIVRAVKLHDSQSVLDGVRHAVDSTRHTLRLDGQVVREEECARVVRAADDVRGVTEPCRDPFCDAVHRGRTASDGREIDFLRLEFQLDFLRRSRACALISPYTVNTKP